MINFEKLAIASVIEGKLKVTDLTVDMFTSRNPRFVYKLIKAYQEKYSSLPSIEVIQATINTQIEPEKAKIYCGYVEGLPEGVTESPEAVLDGLKEDRGIKLLDSKIEELVGLVADRDLVKTRGLLKELLVSTSDVEHKVVNANDAEFSVDNIMMLDSCISDVTNKLQGVTLISAKSGSGKSVMAMNQALHSYKQGNDVLYINLELSQNEAMARMLACELHVPFQDIYTDLDEREVTYYNTKKSEVFSRPNKFKMVNCGVDAQRIMDLIRDEHTSGLQLVVIDYLQIVENENYDEQWKFLSKFVKDLHRLTLELGICILTPIQINEVTEKNGNVSVTARGAQELNFTASLWFHLHQNEEEAKNNLARMFTIKSRHSQRKTYVLQTDFEHMKFHATGLVM